MKSTINHQPLTINQRAFTLVELLIVMAIVSSLAGLFVVSFRSAQIKGKDTQKKSDLKQIASALELLMSDYRKYPNDAGGAIVACPFDATGGAGQTCSWGTGQLSDGKTIYLKKVPADPTSGLAYFYRVVPSANNLKFQLFAHLENPKDPNLISGLTYQCGSVVCNFAVTSANTDYSE